MSTYVTSTGRRALENAWNSNSSVYHKPLWNLTPLHFCWNQTVICHVDITNQNNISMILVLILSIRRKTLIVIWKIQPGPTDDSAQNELDHSNLLRWMIQPTSLKCKGVVSDVWAHCTASIGNLFDSSERVWGNATQKHNHSTLWHYIMNMTLCICIWQNILGTHHASAHGGSSDLIVKMLD